jgi:azurin
MASAAPTASSTAAVLAPSAAPSAPKAEPSATASAKAAPPVELQIASVANTMTFDKNKMSVPAGAEVHLVLKNNATMATLPHNWVLVKKGTEAAVAAAGLKMGEQAGYVDVRDHDVLANTPQAKPGQTVELTFNAPDQAGDYPYICTTPGHYMMMKGVLTVTP